MKKRVLVAAALVLTGCQANPLGRTHALGERVNGPSLEQARWEIQQAIDTRPGDWRLRREFAENLLANSDTLCEHYLVGLAYQRNSAGSGLDLGALLLSAAASVTTPLRNSQLLSAGSTLFQDSEAKLTRRLFAGSDYFIIYRAVKNGRAELRRGLEQRIKEGHFDQWTARSIVDIVTPYHFSCGMNFGLAQINKAVETTGTAKPAEPEKKEDLAKGGTAPAAVKPAAAAITPAAAPSVSRKVRRF